MSQCATLFAKHFPLCHYKLFIQTAMLEPGKLLQNRYQINRRLDSGGMGTIFEALDLRLSTIVAVKENLLSGEEVQKAFEREAQLLANLHHPALPRVIDYFAEGESLYIVMDFIPGEDLRTLLNLRPAPFSWEEVASWLPDLLDALRYLHTYEPQVLHRDLKPANIKLTPDRKLYLLDFGLARGTIGQMTTGTLSRSVFGYSPHYSSLEQIQGERTTVRSDIYALGATLYFLLTKILPPDALSRATALLHDESDPLVLLEQLAPQVPSAVANTINRSLALKPSERPESVEAFHESIFPQSSQEQQVTRTESQEEKVMATVPSPPETDEVETRVVRPPQSPSGRKSLLSPSSRQIAIFMGLLAGITLLAYAIFFRSRPSPISQTFPPPVASPRVSSSVIATQHPSPFPSSKPSPSPEQEKGKEEIDLTGQWEMTNHVVAANYAPYRGLRLGYRISLQQRGSIVTGQGQKVSENDREIGMGARVPINVSGKLEGRQLKLSFVEQGALRSTTGSFQLEVNETGTGLTGTFMQTAAKSRGTTTAKKIS